MDPIRGTIGWWACDELAEFELAKGIDDDGE